MTSKPSEVQDGEVWFHGSPVSGGFLASEARSSSAEPPGTSPARPTVWETAPQPAAAWRSKEWKTSPKAEVRGPRIGRPSPPKRDPARGYGREGLGLPHDSALALS